MLGRMYAGAALRCRNSRGHLDCGQAITVRVGGPVGAGQPQLSNHTVAQPHLRMNLAVRVTDAGKDVCRGCFEMPQQPGASDVWPAHYSTAQYVPVTQAGMRGAGQLLRTRYHTTSYQCLESSFL